jgi:hypothetical protein
MHQDIKELLDYLESVTASKKNRPVQEIVEMRILENKHIAARMFDHITIRQENFKRKKQKKLSI